MKAIKYIALFLSLFVYAASNAQSDTSKFKFKSNSKVKKANPYWSLGLGLDRAFLALPAGGIKIKTIQFDISVMAVAGGLWRSC